MHRQRREPVCAFSEKGSAFLRFFMPENNMILQNFFWGGRRLKICRKKMILFFHLFKQNLSI